MFKKFFLVILTLSLVGTVGCIGDKLANDDSNQNIDNASQLPNQGGDLDLTSGTTDDPRYGYGNDDDDDNVLGEYDSGPGSSADETISIRFDSIITIKQGLAKTIELDATLRNYEGSFSLEFAMQEADQDKVEVTRSGDEITLLSNHPGTHDARLIAFDGAGSELVRKNIQIKVNRNELKITSIELPNAVDYSADEAIRAEIKIKGGSDEYESVSASADSEGLEVNVEKDGEKYFLTLIPNNPGDHEITVTVKDVNANFEQAEKTASLKINYMVVFGTLIETADFNTCANNNIKLIVKSTNAHAAKIVKNEEGYKQFPRIEDEFYTNDEEEINLKLGQFSLLRTELEIAGGVGPFKVEITKGSSTSYVEERDNDYFSLASRRDSHGRHIPYIILAEGDRDFIWKIDTGKAFTGPVEVEITVKDLGCESTENIFVRKINFDIGCQIGKFLDENGQGKILFKASYSTPRENSGYCAGTDAWFALTSEAFPGSRDDGYDHHLKNYLMSNGEFNLTRDGNSSTNDNKDSITDYPRLEILDENDFSPWANKQDCDAFGCSEADQEYVNNLCVEDITGYAFWFDSASCSHDPSIGIDIGGFIAKWCPDPDKLENGNNEDDGCVWASAKEGFEWNNIGYQTEKTAFIGFKDHEISWGNSTKWTSLAPSNAP
ncbi:MAG: hypothetical protein ABH859_05800 [Pseudomonadota bacterium]